MEFHTVQPGDTLYTIALRHGLPMARLMSDNGLTSPALAVGQSLLIRQAAALHTVHAGETLRSIAAQESCSSEELLRRNPGLHGCTYIVPGQRLILPDHEKSQKTLSLLRENVEEDVQLVVLPFLQASERTGRQYEKLFFEEVAQAADFVLLRTPEEHSPVPLPRFQARLESILETISPEKLLVEPDGRAQDRTLSSQPYPLSFLSSVQAEKLAAQHRSSIRFDHSTRLAWFRYADTQGREHEVRFPDLRSADAQLELVERYGLHGVYLPEPAPFSPALPLLLSHRFAIRDTLQ